MLSQRGVVYIRKHAGVLGAQDAAGYAVHHRVEALHTIARALAVSGKVDAKSPLEAWHISLAF